MAALEEAGFYEITVNPEDENARWLTLRNELDKNVLAGKMGLKTVASVVHHSSTRIPLHYGNQ